MSTPSTPAPYTIVVGVSATSGSSAALTWAAAQAAASRGRLVAVRVLKRPADPDTAARTAEDVAALAADVAAVLGPDHGVECRVVRGGKRRGLLTVAAHADLLVIDATRSPSRSSVLAQRIVSSAPCPVVVLPPAVSGVPETRASSAGHAVARSALRAVGTSGRAGYRPPAA